MALKTIGKYIVRGLLGRGGMSKVYKVEIPVIAKIAALKRLDPDPVLVKLMSADAIRRMFVHEAATMARLRHPNIVAIWDFDDHRERPFYLMDYFSDNLGMLMGETYRTDNPSRRLSVDTVLAYTGQILEGLSCLHHAGVVHRDIKPYNILIDGQDRIKICDFGLSKLRGEVFGGPQNLKVGSPYYAAPEQEKAPDHADLRADLYAVGIMFYRMLSGALPNDQAPPLSRLNPALDSQWDAFVRHATAADRRKRFGGADEMHSALGELARRWETQKESVCRLLPPVSWKPVTAPKAKLRQRPLKVRPKTGREVFGTDPLWRPLTDIQNKFVSDHPDTVSDLATDLVWERSGSRYRLPWHQAQTYVDGLNQETLGGLQCWRLPTVAELMSLLHHPGQEHGFCLQSPFDQRQKHFWSSDRRSYCAAWFVSVDLGFVSWQDVTGRYHVKGVCHKSSAANLISGPAAGYATGTIPR